MAGDDIVQAVIAKRHHLSPSNLIVLDDGSDSEDEVPHVTGHDAQACIDQLWIFLETPVKIAVQWFPLTLSITP